MRPSVHDDVERFGLIGAPNRGVCLFHFQVETACHPPAFGDGSSQGRPGPSTQATQAPLRMTVRPARSSASHQTWMRSGPSTR